MLGCIELQLQIAAVVEAMVEQAFRRAQLHGQAANGAAVDPDRQAQHIGPGHDEIPIAHVELHEFRVVDRRAGQLADLEPGCADQLTHHVRIGFFGVDRRMAAAGHHNRLIAQAQPQPHALVPTRHRVTHHHAFEHLLGGWVRIQITQFDFD